MPQNIGYQSPVFGQIMKAVDALAGEAKYQRGLQDFENRAKLKFQRGLAAQDYQTLGQRAQDTNLMPGQREQILAGQREIASTGAVGQQATAGLEQVAPRAEVTEADIYGLDTDPESERYGQRGYEPMEQFQHLVGQKQTLGQRQQMLAQIDESIQAQKTKQEDQAFETKLQRIRSSGRGGTGKTPPVPEWKKDVAARGSIIANAVTRIENDMNSINVDVADDSYAATSVIKLARRVKRTYEKVLSTKYKSEKERQAALDHLEGLYQAYEKVMDNAPADLYAPTKFKPKKAASPQSGPSESDVDAGLKELGF